MMEVILVIIGVAGTLIGTYIGATINKSSNEMVIDKSIRAELISKSRIDWIKEVRELTANYLNEGQQVMLLNVKLEKKEKTDVDTMIKTYSQFKTSHTSMFLYFGIEDDENIKLIKHFDDYYKKIFKENISVGVEDPNTGLDEGIMEYMDDIQKQQKFILQAMNKYLNSQWRRAKNLEYGNTVVNNEKRNNYKGKYDNTDTIDMNEY